MHLNTSCLSSSSSVSAGIPPPHPHTHTHLPTQSRIYVCPCTSVAHRLMHSETEMSSLTHSLQPLVMLIHECFFSISHWMETQWRAQWRSVFLCHRHIIKTHTQVQKRVWHNTQLHFSVRHNSMHVHAGNHNDTDSSRGGMNMWPWDKEMGCIPLWILKTMGTRGFLWSVHASWILEWRGTSQGQRQNSLF